MKRALVLSGGGAKGAYQIGVWRALRKLKIDFDIVTGTSVGALNGTLMVQNDYYKAKRLWKKMNFNFVFDEKILREYNNCKTTKDMIKMFTGNIKKGGLSVDNLEKLVMKYFSKKKFFNSKRDFGVTTYNVSDFKSVKKTKKDLTSDNVIDYIMASSCVFPAFQIKKIGSKKYIDGGFCDYIPINLALDLKAEEIIAVDLKAPGIKEKLYKTNVPITYIEPTTDIGNMLNFNAKNARRGMRIGYLDTMKVYNHLEGKRFTFKKKTLAKCEDYYNEKIVSTMNFIFDFEENKTTLEELLKLAAYKRLTSIGKNNNSSIFTSILDHLSNAFDLNEEKIYSLASFNYNIFKKLKKSPVLNEENVKQMIKERKLTSFLNRRAIIKYFYSHIQLCYKDSTNKKGLCKLALIFPKEFLDALYLNAVKESRRWFWF